MIFRNVLEYSTNFDSRYIGIKKEDAMFTKVWTIL